MRAVRIQPRVRPGPDTRSGSVATGGYASQPGMEGDRREANTHRGRAVRAEPEPSEDRPGSELKWRGRIVGVGKKRGTWLGPGPGGGLGGLGRGGGRLAFGRGGGVERGGDGLPPF